MDMVRELVRNVAKEYAPYRAWRDEQGRPMNGDYQAIRQKIRRPMGRRCLAVKELGRQIERGDPQAVATLLEEVISDCLETHEWLVKRRQLMEKQRKNEEKKRKEAAKVIAEA